MSIENLIVIAFVVAAFAYIGKRIYSAVRHDGTHAGCSKCESIKENKKVPR